MVVSCFILLESIILTTETVNVKASDFSDKNQIIRNFII